MQHRYLGYLDEGSSLMLVKKWFGLGVLAVSLSACGGIGKTSGGLLGTKGAGGLVNTEGRSPTEMAAAAITGAESAHQSLDGEVHGVKLENKSFDIPIVYNDEVEQWLDYFTGSGRKHFKVYLERKARMEPVILPKLKKAGVPQDLIYLAMIESGFSTSAFSHAGASGPWQFIRSTGRLYGMDSNYWVDERRDPHKATDAAIGYLSTLHGEFGDWWLACAAYNSGEGKIRKAIAKLGTRDFWEIAENKRALRRETKDYVPKMMAAAILGKNPTQFGFEVHEADSALLDFEEVLIPKSENLRTIASVAQISRESLATLNPELLRCCTPPQKAAYKIRVPKGESARLLTAAIDAGEIGRYANFHRYVIRRGDNISKIAKVHGVPAEAILSMNEVRNLRSLKLGTELVIPERGGSPYPSRRVIASSGSRKSYKAPSGSKAVFHVVQKGETLYGISSRYSVRVEQIRSWNNVQGAKKLRPGKRIKLYVRNGNS